MFHRLLCLMFILFALPAFAQDDFLPLTEGNNVPGYALPGVCNGFTPDGKYVATSSGLYDVRTGEIHAAFRGFPEISDNGRFMWVGEDGLAEGESPQDEYSSLLFDIESGQQLLEFKDYGAEFSPDGTMIAANTDGLYDLATLERLIAFQIDDWHLYPPKFSPDSRYVIPRESYYNHPVYDTQTGEYLYSVAGIPSFSADGTLLIAEGDGIYDLATGARLFQTTEPVVLSPDNALVAIAHDGIYELESGVERFSFTGIPVFSPDGKFLLVKEDAGGIYVYDLYDVNDPSGQRRLRTIATNGKAAFSPDSQLLFVGGALYETATAKRLQPYWSEPEPGAFAFNRDGSLVAIGGSGLYDVATGEQKVAFTGHQIYFNDDESLLLVQLDGVYEVSTGERLIDLDTGIYGGDSVSFSPDNTLMAFSADGFYLENEQYYRCILVGAEDNPWPFRTGILQSVLNTTSQPYGAPASKFMLYDAPNGNPVEEVFSAGHRYFEMLARTDDNTWFRISDTLWVQAADVEIISMPDTIPVE